MHEAPPCTTLAVRHASPRPSRYVPCVQLSHGRRTAGANRFDGWLTTGHVNIPATHIDFACYRGISPLTAHNLSRKKTSAANALLRTLVELYANHTRAAQFMALDAREIAYTQSSPPHPVPQPRCPWVGASVRLLLRHLVVRSSSRTERSCTMHAIGGMARALQQPSSHLTQ